jgi:hypothetical protein
MESQRRSVSEIVGFLRSRCALRDLKLDRQLFKVEFDAILIGSDPLTVVAVERKTVASERSLRQSIRKAQSFVWSAYTNNKLALLNLVVLVPDKLSPELLHSVEKELSGTARVFVIAETMPIDEVEKRLSLLANPHLAQSSAQGAITGDLETMLVGCDAEALEGLTKGSSSAEELTTKLLDALQTLVAEVDRAIDEA